MQHISVTQSQKTKYINNYNLHIILKFMIPWYRALSYSHVTFDVSPLPCLLEFHSRQSSPTGPAACFALSHDHVQREQQAVPSKQFEFIRDRVAWTTNYSACVPLVSHRKTRPKHPQSHTEQKRELGQVTGSLTRGASTQQLNSGCPTVC